MSALAVTGMLGLALMPTARLSADTVAAARKGVAFNGSPAVGALFTASGGKLTRHFCTASVVHSPSGNLLVTAAHCMHGRSLTPTGHVIFAPQYHGGRFPFGTWPVTAKYVDSRWSRYRNPNDDVAFLTVSGSGSLEARTGAETLTTGWQPPLNVTVIGYPDTRSWPIRCSAPARAFDPGKLRQMVFDCDGYRDGTSGGPFLAEVRKKTGAGRLVGLIGGYETGGRSPNISYSPQLGSRIQNLYDTAVKAATAG